MPNAAGTAVTETRLRLDPLVREQLLIRASQAVKMIAFGQKPLPRGPVRSQAVPARSLPDNRLPCAVNAASIHSAIMMLLRISFISSRQNPRSVLMLKPLSRQDILPFVIEMAHLGPGLFARSRLILVITLGIVASTVIVNCATRPFSLAATCRTFGMRIGN